VNRTPPTARRECGLYAMRVQEIADDEIRADLGNPGLVCLSRNPARRACSHGRPAVPMKSSRS
jgi:hypothetical protein